MALEITRGTLIGALIAEYPSAVEVLFNHGFHCVGCSLSADESVEDGARAHGYTDKDIDEIVAELKDAAKKDIANAGKMDKELKKSKPAWKSAGGMRITPKE